MIKILIGGSPCTFWSIAQKKHRETEAEGMGWELFKNYLIAKEKFKPDLFLYENNKSAAQAIKNQISRELGVDLMYINSALVSAQNRQRFYAFNWEVEQPEDRGILLKDILESGVDCKYCNDKNMEHLMRPYGSKAKIVSECMEKSPTLMAAMGTGGKTGLYAIPAENPESYLGEKMVGYAYKEGTKNFKQRVKILEDKSCPLTTEQNKRAGTTNYIPQNIETIDYEITTDGTAKNAKPIYEVKDGLITINGKQYPIKLPDGYYIIRKLTVTECCRLQTMPDDYCRVVSNAQAYKGLGNGWTAEVIIHILNGALKDVPKDEEIIVLSMYDGIGTGRYCLDKMGFTNVKYFSYEIDKYAMQVAKNNFPDIIQRGDAFAVREKNWHL